MISFINSISLRINFRVLCLADDDDDGNYADDDMSFSLGTVVGITT